MKSSKLPRQLLEAIGAWIGFFFLYSLPFTWASGMFAGIGRALGPRARASERARANIRACFPGLSSVQIEDIIREMWDNFGRVIAEYAHPRRFWNGKTLKDIEIVGAENLIKLRDDGKPGIIFTAHTGNWQMITLVAQSLGMDMTQMYRAANNPWVDSLMLWAQKRVVKNVITKKDRGPRDLLALIRQGGHALMLIDQKMGEGMAVPFLGRKAMTAKGVARLYLNQDCPLLPARCERISPYKFRVTFYPPVDFKATGERDQDVYNLLLSLNTLMGSWIIERPGQWLWLHRRWT